jgi:hypothetical protein
MTAMDENKIELLNNKGLINHRLSFLNFIYLKNLSGVLILILSMIFINTQLFSSENDKLYLSPPKESTPQIYKYLFYPENNASGTLITQTRSESSTSKTDSKKSSTIAQDSTSENSIQIYYDNYGDPIKLILKMKDKDKKVQISLYNMIGNKVADVYEGIPGANEKEIENFRTSIESLSNGVYICVLQGINIRLKLYQKFTISR